jgi:hypothetical protein
MYKDYWDRKLTYFLTHRVDSCRVSLFAKFLLDGELKMAESALKSEIRRRYICEVQCKVQNN